MSPRGDWRRQEDDERGDWRRQEKQDYTQILTESISINDSISKGISMAFQEDINILDDQVKLPGKILLDQILITADIEKFNYIKSLVNNININSDISVDISKLLIDNISINDQITKGSNKIFTELVSITDELTRCLGTEHVFEEFISVNDILIKSTSKLLIDNISILDELSKIFAGELVQILTENININDQTLFNIGKSIQDNISVDD